MSKGWIKLHRKFDQSDISRKPPHFRELWFYLLRQANHKDNAQNGIKRGQLYRTYNQICDDLHWYEGFIKRSYSKHQIEKAMQALREASMVATRKTTRGMLITICKYDTYQAEDVMESDTVGKWEAKQSGRYKQECSKNEKERENSNLSDFFDLTIQEDKNKVFPPAIVEELGIKHGYYLKEMKKAYDNWLLKLIEKSDEVRTIKQHRAGFEQYLINCNTMEGGNRYKKNRMQSR